MFTKMMSVSSGHLTPKTRKLLSDEAHGRSNNLSAVVYDKTANWLPTGPENYGFFVYMPAEGNLDDWKDEYLTQTGESMPEDLVDLFQYAVKNHVGFICIDGDGPELEELTLYDEDGNVVRSLKGILSAEMLHYTVPMLGNKHIHPYGTLLVSDGVKSQRVKFELDSGLYGTVTFQRKKYRVRNVGDLMAPRIVVVEKL